MEPDVVAAPAITAARPNLIVRIWGVFATVMAVVWTVLLMFPALGASLFDNGHLSTPVIWLWAWLILRTCGITVELDGLENIEGLRSFVLVSNHKSLLDIIAVISMIPREMRFVAKREIKKIPVIGSILERSQNIVIDRASGGKTIRRALFVAQQGYTICVFAEGHRYNDDVVHDFNDGAAWLAIATKLPCVPMAITGTAALMPRGSMFLSPGKKIRMVFSKPIPTQGLRSADRTGLTERLEKEVRALFSER